MGFGFEKRQVFHIEIKRVGLRRQARVQAINIRIRRKLVSNRCCFAAVVAKRLLQMELEEGNQSRRRQRRTRVEA
jgi:hypothetical protein